MTKTKTQFACQSCGTLHVRWTGKCEGCGEWNTVVEESIIVPDASPRPSLHSRAVPTPITAADHADVIRMLTGMPECDRVLGGGIVPGSLTLVGGDPGIGKSTLMLQVGHQIARELGPVLYVSGEESFAQTRLRAQRLGSLTDDLMLLTETDVDTIRKAVLDGHYALVVVDSIQSVYTPRVTSAPGSVSQVREAAGEFLSLAKGEGVPIVLVGHVTKDGSIAGPRVLEHLVDTVLYFEGEGRQTLRILRAVKNRFGSTNEIGIFEMGEAGLREVPNPSALFLNERPKGVSGSVVIPSVEGTRPLLVEVQALVGESTPGSPRRTATGLNPNRVSLILAVLEKRCSYHFSDRDVFVNVAGGVRIEEPAADLAVAIALVSSLTEKPVSATLAAFGEVGLAGEVRGVNRARQRIAEASKFGFTTCILPQSSAADAGESGLELLAASGIAQAIELALEL